MPRGPHQWSGEEIDIKFTRHCVGNPAKRSCRRHERTWILAANFVSLCAIILPCVVLESLGSFRASWKTHFTDPHDCLYELHFAGAQRILNGSHSVSARAIYSFRYEKRTIVLSPGPARNELGDEMVEAYAGPTEGVQMMKASEWVRQRLYETQYEKYM